jgi:hypothetical protein
VYPICSALNLIVSIESAKSINYQLCGKQHHKKRILIFKKAYFPKPAHRPEKLHPKQGFFPSCTIIDFPVRR